MARTAAGLPSGTRLTYDISLGVLTAQCPIEDVQEALLSKGRVSERERDLPAHVMVYSRWRSRRTPTTPRAKWCAVCSKAREGESAPARAGALRRWFVPERIALDQQTVKTKRFALIAGAAMMLGAVGCSTFLEPDNPNLLDVNAVDPVNDASTLANSAQQSYASALGWAIMHGAWFTGEALVAETFPTRNEFGRRDVASANGSLSTDLWFPISQAASSAHLVLGLALPTPATNINNVRSQTWLGYSFVLMAEYFCEGAVYGGPRLTTQNMLDSAVANFTAAIASGTANATTAGIQLADVARVGRARAYLQQGKKAEALADANLVPAGFNFNFHFVDDAGNRTRLNNRLWQFTSDRGSISVSPTYQAFADPRVRFGLPGTHNLSAQDANSGPFVI